MAVRHLESLDEGADTNSIDFTIARQRWPPGDDGKPKFVGAFVDVDGTAVTASAPLTIITFTQAAHGVLSFSAGGLLYQPDAGTASETSEARSAACMCSSTSKRRPASAASITSRRDQPSASRTPTRAR